MLALDDISKYCGVDIFLLGPKLTPVVDGLNGDVELRRDQRWRVAIYGDLLSSEHGKTRVLIYIDRMVPVPPHPLIYYIVEFLLTILLNISSEE